mmetsp:Transcript_35067/g.81412  ORF Transcript_35067/g.81412 Transcript_35067/m.81412 type:complete len:327 (+) Transcript_35067:64-1044(+)
MAASAVCLWALLARAAGVHLRAQRGPSALCQTTHALDRLVNSDCHSLAPKEGDKNQYVFVISDLCRGGGGAPLREGGKDRLRSCNETSSAFLDEAKYAIATLQATGAQHGITVLMHQGLENKAGALDSFNSWLSKRGVTAKYVPGKADDAHMYYFMKSYLWDLTSFKKVAYFDTDFVFLRNPDAAFSECKKDFCAAPVVASTIEAITSHRLAGSDAFSQRLAQWGSQRRSSSTKNAWSAGFFIVSPNPARGERILAKWRRCDGAENFCLNQAITRVHAMSPIYNLQHSTVEGNIVRVGAVPTVAVHGKVGRMRCEIIDKTFGQMRC